MIMENLSLIAQKAIKPLLLEIKTYLIRYTFIDITSQMCFMLLCI